MNSIFQILLEDRAPFLLQNFGDKLLAASKNDKNLPAEEVIELLKKADPTPRGLYLTWLVNQYVKKGFRIEDLGTVGKALQQFNQIKPRLEKKDINQYPHISDVEDAVEKAAGNDSNKSNKEIARDIKAGGAKKIIQTPDFQALEILNQEAACYYGSGTRWCTAADKDNMFNEYSKDLYILILKTPNGVRKFQIHPKSEQFMDEKDRSVDQSDIALLSKSQGYTDFLNYLINKFYKPMYDKLKDMDIED